MRYTALILFMYLLPVLAIAQGSTCSNAYPVPTDGILHTYAPSTTTGSSVVCTAYSTSSPVTWFSFTTNPQAECPLLNINASGTTEVALYTACNGGQALQSMSSMCFDDGVGLWAPAETMALDANTTYYLRIKTAGSDSLRIAAQYHVPANNKCEGATSVSTTPFTDNNACHHPGPGIFADQLCAFTIENTAFYQFYVASDGTAIINISSISCDNGSLNNSSGFQIGFFTGSCGALLPLNCTSGSGSFVQASTEPLPANTHVYVAIDGISGSNCLYSIQGINVFGVLAAEQLNHFSAWNTASSTILKWESKNDMSQYFDVERSENGIKFHPVGRVNRKNNSSLNNDYSFEDKMPKKTAYYRLKQVNKNGEISLSRIIKSTRETMPVRIDVSQTINGRLHIGLQGEIKEPLLYFITNVSGQVIEKGVINSFSGDTKIIKDISYLSSGKYFISFSGKSIQSGAPFTRMP